MRDFLIQALPLQGTVHGLFDQIAPISATGGAGAFSAVFKARHIPTGGDVALKFMIPGAHPYRAASFLREGQLLATTLKGESLFVRLVEPPATLDFPVASSPAPLSIPFPYLALEWHPNGDVSRHANATTGYLDLLLRLEIFNEMCRCVSRLHFLGCAHRDLKPTNFLLVGSNGVRLGDFGTSREIAVGTPTLLPTYPGPVGDQRYAGPEALALPALRDRPDLLRAADMYALGSILFELISGQTLSSHTIGTLMDIKAFNRMFAAVPTGQVEQVFRGFLRGRGAGIPAIRSINPGIPKCVAPLLMRILEQLAHFDYARRAQDLISTHRILRMAMIVLRHEARAKRIIHADKARRERDIYA